MSQQQVAALLDFIPALEAPGFCPGGQIPLDETQWPEADFLHLVSRFMDACYKNGFVVRFNWEHWDSEALALESDPARLRNADRATLRRLLTWHVRQNRFARTHLAGKIASGHILALLKRLGET